MKPCSPMDRVAGMAYFPRMLHKVRLRAEDALDPDYHENCGLGVDGKCLEFLRVKYEVLVARVLQGGSDLEILKWCYENGRRLNKTDIVIWNGFVTKLGWNDFASDYLTRLKAESGMSEREDIQTLPHLIDVDEGRKN